MNSFEIILLSLDIIWESRIWKDKPPSYILKILTYLHSKGWLYTPLIDNEIVAVIAAYRIPEITEENLDRLPIKEEGNILYVPFVISTKKEDNIFEVVRESTRQYLIDNPDIIEIVLQGKDDRLKRFKIGEFNGKI